MAQLDLFRVPPRRWNMGRMIGPKPPLKPKHIWAIRHHLKTSGRVRDLALFNCAIDAKLRGCDLVKLKVSDIAPGGVLRDRAPSSSRRPDAQCRSRSPNRRARRC